MTGFSSYENFQDAHRDLIDASLANSNNSRQPQWTESIAVGSKSFIETIQGELGARAKGRKVLESESGFQLRENMVTYIDDFDCKNGNIDTKNTYYWDVNI